MQNYLQSWQKTHLEIKKKRTDLKTILENKVSWNIIDDIGYISFVDPPQNSMNAAFFEELQFLSKEVIPANNPSALIIHGKGRHFSSGADLDNLLRLINEEKELHNTGALLSNYQSFQFFNELNIPVVAAIRGVCIGSALELALHCHFRLCSNDAILGLPESTFGLIPGVGGIPKLMERTGKAKAIELVLKGNTFNAEYALKWNIIDAVYPKKILMDKAIQLVQNAKKNYKRYNKSDYIKQLNTPD